VHGAGRAGGGQEVSVGQVLSVAEGGRVAGAGVLPVQLRRRSVDRVVKDLGRAALERPVRPQHDLVRLVLVVAVLNPPHRRGRRIRALRLGVVRRRARRRGADRTQHLARAGDEGDGVLLAIRDREGVGVLVVADRVDVALLLRLPARPEGELPEHDVQVDQTLRTGTVRARDEDAVARAGRLLGGVRDARRGHREIVVRAARDIQLYLTAAVHADAVDGPAAGRVERADLAPVHVIAVERHQRAAEADRESVRPHDLALLVDDVRVVSVLGDDESGGRRDRAGAFRRRQIRGRAADRSSHVGRVRAHARIHALDDHDAVVNGRVSRHAEQQRPVRCVRPVDRRLQRVRGGLAELDDRALGAGEGGRERRDADHPDAGGDGHRRRDRATHGGERAHVGEAGPDGGGAAHAGAAAARGSRGPGRPGVARRAAAARASCRATTARASRCARRACRATTARASRGAGRARRAAGASLSGSAGVPGRTPGRSLTRGAGGRAGSGRSGVSRTRSGRAGVSRIRSGRRQAGAQRRGQQGCGPAQRAAQRTAGAGARVVGSLRHCVHESRSVRWGAYM